VVCAVVVRREHDRDETRVVDLAGDRYAPSCTRLDERTRHMSEANRTTFLGQLENRALQAPPSS